MQELPQGDQVFIKKVVGAWTYFKKNPNSLKKGSVAEAMFNLLNNELSENENMIK